jgi:phosphatidylinositol alpha-1,6-mannosyltransferase
MMRRIVAMSAANSYDLVVCGVAYPMAVLAFANWLITRTPFAVYSHGEDVTCVQNSGLARRSLAQALRSARVIMTNSTFTKRQVEALGVSAEQVICCPPWIDSRPYEQVSDDTVEDMRRRLGLSGKKVILTLARLVERKGHDMVVRSLPQVARQVPDVHYLVVGKGDQSRLKGIADELGVADRLTIVEEIADEELAPAFRLADVNIMVSRWDREKREVEGFGIVYLEAAACGRPSISGNVGGPPDAVEHGVTGYIVDSESVDEIAGALVTLLTDNRLSDAMGKAGRERVRKCFSKSVILDRIENLLGLRPAVLPQADCIAGVAEA